jgi:ABC-type uncharacterized transport system permease subunit
MSTATLAPKAPSARRPQFRQTWVLYLLFGLFAFAAVRVITGANEIDTPGTLRAAFVATCPILMCGIGGLWSERAGVVNIGLEGQMILGTWGGAYFCYYYGPWAGVLGAAIFGAIGGLLHAIATVSFGVDHIVSGVAINIIGAGAVKFLAEAYFSDLEGGGIKQLNGLESPSRITIPGLSDAAINVADRHWFLVSDIASLVAALTSNLSSLIVLAIVLIFVTAWVLWRTPFGLRLRACGENPAAAETLGVNVYLYKYIAVMVSGAFAGVGGAFLIMVASSGFTTGQTGGRGYIGLAAMIFGNWQPVGTVVGALMFGYTDSLQLRSSSSVHALLLLVVIALGAFALLRLRQRHTVAAGVLGSFAAAFLVWYLTTKQVPVDFSGMTPYVATLLVLALAAQRLRMPAADGLRYRRGQSI